MRRNDHFDNLHENAYDITRTSLVAMLLCHVTLINVLPHRTSLIRQGSTSNMSRRAVSGLNAGLNSPKMAALLEAYDILSSDLETTDLEPDIPDPTEYRTQSSSEETDDELEQTIGEEPPKPELLSSEDTYEAFYADYCTRYLHFTNTNPTTFHAVDFFATVLQDLHFSYLSEKCEFDILPAGGLYYSTRDLQSLVAVVLGGKWKPENGIGVVGCHVDALTAKLKPTSVKKPVSGYQLLGVAPYSGALNHLWLDRDLGIAGRVLVKNSSSSKIEARLVSSGQHAVCRIPSLAPHFGAVSLVPYNKETQMVPVMAFGEEKPPTKEEEGAPLFGKHSLTLLRYVAELANTTVEQLVSLDLELFDVQTAVRGGIHNEFMFAPRVDDRLCSYSAIHALREYLAKIDLASYSGCSIVLLANNEEIGSGTRSGARGKFLNSVVERIVTARGRANSVRTVFANSVILSADVTHALNPNFTSAYLEGHFPVPNTGLTLKKDANGHVMTDLVGTALMEAIAAKNGLTLQQFHIRNDMPSGGTIGPMLAVDTGARVVDVGLAQLSMHSIRATAGYKEAGLGVETFSAFFRDWREQLDLIDCL